MVVRDFPSGFVKPVGYPHGIWQYPPNGSDGVRWGNISLPGN
jgi:hypothetical protein